MDFTEKFVSRDDRFKGRIFSVSVDDIIQPDGKPSKREVVHHNGAVCVAPLTDDNTLVFVRQYRYPMAEVMLELPAGRIEPGEDPVETAKRELIEEAGRLNVPGRPIQYRTTPDFLRTFGLSSLEDLPEIDRVEFGSAEAEAAAEAAEQPQ